MEFDEKDYILGSWFADDTEGNNFLMSVKRDPETPKGQKQPNWIGEYRFRYKVDDRSFGSKDKKNFYRFTATKVSEKNMLNRLQFFFDEVVREKYSAHSAFVDVRGDVRKFEFKMAQEEFTHLKKFNNQKEYEDYVQQIRETDDSKEDRGTTPKPRSSRDAKK